MNSKDKKTSGIKEGDVFITKLERDFFGAFKILRTGRPKGWRDQDSLMIGILDFIAPKKPTIEDLKKITILHAQRFNYDKLVIDLFVADSTINNIGDYEYLGNVPLSEQEKQYPFALGMGLGFDDFEGFPMVGVLGKGFGREMFFEWRWRDHKEDFIKEVENGQKERENRILQPKKMMDDKLFWKIIALIDWSKDDDDERLAPAITFLSNLSEKDIEQFEENLTFKLYLLDTKEHAENIGASAFINNETYFSADTFLYARSCVVANGQTYFESVLKNPIEMPKDMDFEAILYLAEKAYYLKTGKELDYFTGCDYETYSNTEGWK